MEEFKVFKEGEKMNKYIITFDKSNEDIPTLVVSEENYFALNPSMNIVKIFTGKEAVRIWNKLSGKVEESEE